jgi:hypothetical protein
MDRTLAVWTVGVFCAAVHYQHTHDELGALVVFVLTASAASLFVAMTK